MHFIEEVFGEGCDLYADVLKCPRDADRAKLRKGYYRAALEFHPDRNPSSEVAHRQFQAISLCYRILSDADSRADYDETGAIPDDAPDDEDRDFAGAAGKTGSDQWKQYFDRTFGKVTRTDIAAFATKYKCSDEERRDVLKEFVARKGNLVKMLDFVMLSEPRDAARWAEDYILPALEKGDVKDANGKYRTAMEKSLKTCQKKADKENEEEQEEDDADEDDSETETDEDMKEEEAAEKEDLAASKRQKKKPQQQKKETPKKGRPTKAKAKPKKKKDDMSDLVAQIQNKHRGGGGGGGGEGGGGGVFASLGARYGVSVDGSDDEDPLNDAEFERIQSKMASNKRRKK